MTLRVFIPSQNSHSEMEATLQAVTDLLTHTRTDLEKQRSLNERLETDLLQLNPHPSTTSSQAAANGTAASGSLTPSESGLGGLNLGVQDKSASGTRSGTPTIPFASAADTSILPIVTNQRDRFRQRNSELEEVRFPPRRVHHKSRKRALIIMSSIC